MIGNGLDGAVDGFDLVIAGFFTATVFVVGLSDQFFVLVGYAAIVFVALPNLVRWQKGIQCKLGFYIVTGIWHFVMGGKSVAVGTEGAGHLQNIGIAQSLLQAMAGGVLVVFGLDDGNRNAGFPIQHIVGEFLLFLVAGRQVAAHDDRPGGQSDFASDLSNGIPAGIADSRGDEKVADVGFAEGLFVFAVHT